MSKLRKKPSALKRDIQHFKTWNFLIFSTFGGHFCPPGSGSTDPMNPEWIRIQFESGFATLKLRVNTKIWLCFDHETMLENSVCKVGYLHNISDVKPTFFQDRLLSFSYKRDNIHQCGSIDITFAIHGFVICGLPIWICEPRNQGGYKEMSSILADQ